MADDNNDKPNDSTPKDNKDSKPQPPSRWAKRFGRFFRALFAFLVVILPTISFGLTCATITSQSWMIKGDSSTWVAVSPAAGSCSCTTTHTSYCRETSDAFEGTSYLSLAIIGAEFIAISILLIELAMYGLFGGSHSFTRLVLIVALVALATMMLSVISWFATYSNKHCGDPSFQTNGATLGWAIIVRILEMALMAIYVFYTIALFSKPNRGPPSLPALSLMFFMAITCLTSFSGDWMSMDGLKYGTWASCTCTANCDASKTLFTVVLAMTVLAAVFGFVTLFFTVLRAVDNEGATLKFATILAVVTFIFQIVAAALGVTVYGTAGDNCASAGLSVSPADDNYKWGWALYCAISAAAAQFAFVILNIVYQMPACCELSEEELANMPPGTDPKRSVFQAFWWDELKDARRLAHEARDEEDLEEEDSDDEEDDNEQVAEGGNVDSSAVAGNKDDEDHANDNDAAKAE